LTGHDNDNPRLNAPAVGKLFSAPPLGQPAFLTTLLLRRPNGTPLNRLVTNGGEKGELGNVAEKACRPRDSG